MNRPRLLLVDADPLVQSKFRSFLDPVADVVAVGNGMAALRRLPAERFDIAMICVELPDMSGVALCAALRLIQPAMRRFLLSEGWEIEELSESPEAVGAAGVLLKPVAFSAVLEEIERVAALAA